MTLTNAYCFGWNSGARGEHLTIQLLWVTAGLLVTRFIVKGIPKKSCSKCSGTLQENVYESLIF